MLSWSFALKHCLTHACVVPHCRADYGTLREHAFGLECMVDPITKGSTSTWGVTNVGEK